VLGRSIETWQAAFLSFAIGTVALAMIAALAKGGLGQLSGVRDVGWVYLTGVLVDQVGLLGVERSPVTAEEVAGLALLAAGTYLVVRA